MTSSRRRTWRRAARPRLAAPWMRRALVFALAIAVFGGAVFAFLHLAPLQADRAAAQAETQRAQAFLAKSNATAARSQALDAVRHDSKNADAQIALARAYLGLDDGIAAEGALNHAVAAGYDATRIHHWMAHALLLQGDTERALTEVEKTDPDDRPYGLRIRARILTATGDLSGANAAIQEAIRVSPGDAATWVAAGRFRMIAGDMLGAIEASERAVRIDGGNIDALILRGETVRAQYGLVAAIPWFEAALEVDPWHHDALIEYAATLGDAGRTNAMLAVTRKALQAVPDSPQAYYLQAVLAARAGNYDLARSLVEHTKGALDDVPGMLLLGGTLDLQSGAYQQAVEKLEQLVGAQPFNITARTLLGIAYLRSDMARNALDLLRPVVLRNDADSYALTLVARGFERIGERDYAARFLDRAAWPLRAEPVAFGADDSVPVAAQTAGERPNDPTAVIPLMRAQIDAGDMAGAMARAQRLARDNPGAPGAHLLLGDLLMLDNRFGDAAAAYQRAADLRFDEPTMLRLVEALDRAGRREDAARVLALFLSQNPANLAALRLTAHWQVAAGDFDAAIDTLESIRDRIGDGDPALDAELAYAYLGAGELDTGADLAESAYGMAPSNPAAADAYGWALMRGGDVAGAVELLEKAVKLAPGHAGIRWHLAQAYAAAKRLPEARAQAQAALRDASFTDRAAAQALISG